METVEFGYDDYHDDRTALDAICSAVPPELVPTLATKASAHEAWEAIKTMRVGDERARKTTAQALRVEYEQIGFRDGESVEDFALRLTNLVQRLAILGDPEPEAKVVAKYLCVAHPKYRQLIVSIETLLDISTLSVEEVAGRLKAATDDDPAPPQTLDSKLLLTHDEWLEKYKKSESGHGASSSSGRGKRRSRGRGRGGGGGNAGLRAGTPAGQSSSGEAGKRCGKSGHWAKDCRAKKPMEQVQVAQDDEPTLLLAVCDVTEEGIHPQIESPPLEQRGSAPPTSPSAGQLHLVKDRVFAAFNDSDDLDPKRWVLDTGASNYMSGSRAAFADLDSGISGSVRFGDGSVAKIEGIGTILFSCKNGEHRAFPNVYYLLRLTTNIVSVGQLDKGGYQVLVEDGMMRIRDEERCLLARVHWNPGRLYVLDVTIARAICLAARTNDEAWIWHARFGHLHFGALRQMARDGLVCGLPQIAQVEQLCEACLAGKQRRAPFPQKALRRSTEPLQLLHGDLCGPITPATPSGKRYFLLLVDHYSRYMWVSLLSTKDEAAAAIKKIQAAAERKSGKKLMALRTNRGGEFNATDFT